MGSLLMVCDSPLPSGGGALDGVPAAPLQHDLARGSPHGFVHSRSADSGRQLGASVMSAMPFWGGGAQSDGAPGERDTTAGGLGQNASLGASQADGSSGDGTVHSVAAAAAAPAARPPAARSEPEVHRTNSMLHEALGMQVTLQRRLQEHLEVSGGAG